MKITEISWENGKEYVDNNEKHWMVYDRKLIDNHGWSINEIYSLFEISCMDFERFSEKSELE